MWFKFRQGHSLFSLVQYDKAGGGFLPISNSMSNWNYFSRSKTTIAWSLPPFDIEVMNEYSYNSAVPAGSHGMHTENFNFLP